MGSSLAYTMLSGSDLAAGGGDACLRRFLLLTVCSAIGCKTRRSCKAADVDLKLVGSGVVLVTEVSRDLDRVTEDILAVGRMGVISNDSSNSIESWAPIPGEFGIEMFTRSSSSESSLSNCSSAPPNLGSSGLSGTELEDVDTGESGVARASDS